MHVSVYVKIIIIKNICWTPKCLAFFRLVYLSETASTVSVSVQHPETHPDLWDMSSRHFTPASEEWSVAAQCRQFTLDGKTCCVIGHAFLMLSCTFGIPCTCITNQQL